MKRALVVWFVALAIGAVWMPAAGAATVSVEEYVNHVCTSIATFGDATDQASQTIQEKAGSLTKVPQVKKEFVAFFDSLHAAVTQLQSDLADAGTPQLAHGSAIAKQLRSGIDSIEKVVADARKSAAALKTSNPKQFTNKVTALGKKLNQAYAEIGSGFDGLPKKYDTSSLKAAQQADSECAVLNR
ncbi:MAG TPA: hypothetical protein VFZ17_06855 [Acidimicrobiia bacterium]|nr:hypothetical protein [Acidimicrobiia bacterium]